MFGDNDKGVLIEPPKTEPSSAPIKALIKFCIFQNKCLNIGNNVEPENYTQLKNLRKSIGGNWFNSHLPRDYEIIINQRDINM